LTDWFFITVVESVYCAVRAHSLYKADYVYSSKGYLHWFEHIAISHFSHAVRISVPT